MNYLIICKTGKKIKQKKKGAVGGSNSGVLGRAAGGKPLGWCGVGVWKGELTGHEATASC